MTSKSQQPTGRSGLLSSLNVAIEVMNAAEEIVSVTSAKAVFSSVCVLLTMIRETVTSDQDYVELGLDCADVCGALDRGTNGKKLDDLSQPVCDAINQLTTTVAEIQRKVIKQGKRNPASQLSHAKDDKDAIAAWKQELNRILHVFNTELAVDNVSDAAS